MRKVDRRAGVVVASLALVAAVLALAPGASAAPAPATQPGGSQGCDDSFGECRPPQPVADGVVDCAEGGVRLSMWNYGDIGATFEITVTGGAAPQVDDVDIAGDGDVAREVIRIIPIPEDQSRTIRIVAAGFEIMDQEFTRDCELDLDAAIVATCDDGSATGLVSVRVFNDTDADADVTVHRDGAEVDSFTVPAGAERSVEYDHEPGVPATFAVMGPDGTLLDSADVVVTCVQGNVIDRPTPSPSSPQPGPALSGVQGELPRTGPDGLTVLALVAAALVAAGGLLAHGGAVVRARAARS
jgi:LPXTG-motif cell wall-anchored protein